MQRNGKEDVGSRTEPQEYSKRHGRPGGGMTLIVQWKTLVLNQRAMGTVESFQKSDDMTCLIFR